MRYKDYISNLYRPAFEKDSRAGFICMDKNEPPFSAFDVLDNIFDDNDIKSLRIYPNPYELYEKLSSFCGVNINQLLITQGSEQAIEFVFRIFLESSDEVVYLKPSFAMFDVFAYMQKAKVKHIEFNQDLSLSVDTIISSITKITKLLVLANPNNPTGTAFNLHELKCIAEHTQKTNTIFLLDEAYFHFYNIKSTDLVNQYKHVIITRTFSKALGIAGARVGYVISHEKNIELLRKIKPIDEINQLSNILAKKVIDSSQLILEKNISQVNKWKEIFKTTDLKDLTYIDTEGNFILIKSNRYEYHKILFLKNKIFPKMGFTQNYLKDCFRLSILDDDSMNIVIKILK